MTNEIENLKKEIDDLKVKLQTGYKATMPQQDFSTSQSIPNITKNFEEKELYSWDAPVRIFKRWERNSPFSLAILATIGLCLLLIVLQEYMLAGTIIILTALCIILATIAPPITHHKITNKGIFSLGKLYLWEELGQFWFAERKGTTIMYVETKLHYPGKLFFIVQPEFVKDIVTTLNPYIKYFDRTANQDFVTIFTEGKYIHFNDLKKLDPSI